MKTLRFAACALLLASCATTSESTTSESTMATRPARARAPLPWPANFAAVNRGADNTAPVAAPEREWAPPTVTRRALANGIAVLHVPLQSAQIALRYCNARVSEDDVNVQAGLPSLTTTLLAEGTRAHPGASLAVAFASIGARLRLGTSREGTCLSVLVSPDDFDAAAALMLETVREPAFAESSFAAARTAQMDERANGVLSPSAVPRLMAHDFIFGAEHAYGRPETGLGPQIRERTLEQVRAFHSAYFVPANSALIVAGGDAERVQATLGRTFGAWTSTSGAPAIPARSVGTIAPRRAARVHIIDTGRSERTHLLVAWSGPARHSEHWPSLIVLERILGGMFASRLNLALREDEGYSYGAHSALSLARFGGLILASSQVETSNAAHATWRVLDEVRLLRERDITAEELATARALEHAEFQRSWETPSAAAATAAELYLYDLPLDYFTRLERSIRTITAFDVKRAAQRHLSSSEMLLVIAGPRDELAQGIAALRLSAIETWNFQR